MSWSDHPFGLMGVILGIPARGPLGEEVRLSWYGTEILPANTRRLAKHAAIRKGEGQPYNRLIVEGENQMDNRWAPFGFKPIPGDPTYDEYGNRRR